MAPELSLRILTFAQPITQSHLFGRPPRAGSDPDTYMAPDVTLKTFFIRSLRTIERLPFRSHEFAPHEGLDGQAIVNGG